MASATTSRVAHTAVLASAVRLAAASVTQVAALVAHAPESARYVECCQSLALVSNNIGVNAVLNVTQAALLVGWRSGVPTDLAANAWTFTFDGHAFYVIALGSQGTFVYDLTTKQWASFQTTGFDGVWNACYGVAWNNGTYVGDLQYGYLWKLDPDSTVDEGWRTISYAVTGLIAMRNRRHVRNDAFRLVASAGNVSEDGSILRLRVSDDNGNTFGPYHDIVLVSGNTTQELSWRSLGVVRSPGRVYEVSSEGGLRRIDDATTEIEGLEDGSQGSAA